MASIQIDIKDGLSSSVAIKGPCRVATTANITLVGEQTIDGVAVVTDDRVLVKNQTTASENGIYIADTGNWRRSKDFNKTKDIKTGTMVNVVSGTVGAGQWQVSTTGDITVGTTSIAFIQVVQPYDADLAAIAALSTQPYGRSLLTLASSTALAGELAAFYQPLDSDLTAIAALTTTTFGRALLTAAAAADLRLTGVVPVYCTLAQLVGLDTTKDTVAVVADSSAPDDIFKWSGSDLSSRTVVQSVTTTSVNSGTDVITKVAHGLSTGMGVVSTTAVNGLSLNTVYWFRKIDADTGTLHPTVEDAIGNTNIFDLTGTTNFTIKQLRDPLQDVYVIKTGGQLDGTGGAWIRAKSSHSLGIGRARFHRFNDKVLVGLGATGWMGDHSGTTSGSGVGTWLADEIQTGGTTSMSYLTTNAQFMSANNPVAGFPPYAIVGASRSPSGADSNGYLGVAGFASGHATSGASVIWGAYFEGKKDVGSNSSANGVEIEVTNLNSTPTSPVVSPEATYVQGRTFGIFVATGGGPSTNPTAYDADSAIFVGTNPAKFRTGLTFYTGSLTKDAGTNYQHAILMPSKARIEWYTSDATSNYAFTIHSEISTLANSQYWKTLDGEFRMLNNNGGIYGRWLTNTSATGNYPYLQASAPGSGVTYSVEGGDTNINLILTPKGTGSVVPASNDAAALGTTALSWSDLFLASGAVVNFNNGNYTVTHSAGTLTFSAGASWGGALLPTTDDGAALGSTTKEWSDLFLASGGVINWANGNASITHGTAGRIVLSGSLGRGAPVVKAVDFTVADTDNWLICNQAATTTVTLPSAASYPGREIMIKTILAQLVNSASSNVVPLVGGSAGTAILAATAGKWATLVSNGSNWLIMQGN